MKAVTANQPLITRLFHHITKSGSPNSTLVKEIPVPAVDDAAILVKVTAVALNPTDFKHADVVSPRGAILGCDFAGVVAHIGKFAPGNWTIGDRVAGVVHGGLYPDKGSFAEYLVTPGDLAWKIPHAVSDAEAATYGISAVTAMLGLNVHLDVPWLDESEATHGAPILIYAGSTCAGLFAIQVAKQAGLRVIATASPRSFDLVKRYGADLVFDYRSTTAEEIAAKYPDIDRAMDCFSEGKSTEFCASVVQGNKGKVITLLDTGKKMPGVHIDFILMYTVFGQPFSWLPPVGPSFPAKPEDRAALVRFYRLLPTLCGRLKSPPMTQIEGGLDNIAQGLQMLREGKVSGSKLVGSV